MTWRIRGTLRSIGEDLIGLTAEEKMVPLFRDRKDAGFRLATRLLHLKHRDDTIVLGLPRGGIPVAYEIALALDAPLDLWIVRKLGVPGFEELAMGAITSGGIRFLNDEIVSQAGVSEGAIEAVEAREQRELQRRERLYRVGGRIPNLQGNVVILVDDGLATGSTMRVAAEAIRQRRPAQLIGATPVAAAEICERVGEFVDEMICLETPDHFTAVGLWYENFESTGDRDVIALLHRASLRALTHR